MKATKLESLSDDALVERVDNLLARGRRQTAQLLVLLNEVEERRLHLRAGYSSMFDYCIRRFSMSEGEAYRRITAARLVRRFPSLLSLVARGEVHLTLLVSLRHYLTPENVDELIEATRGKSKYAVAELLAGRAPRPDAPGKMRKLPTLRTANGVTPTPTPESAVQPTAESRYRLEVTIGRELRDKIERLADLMMHANPQRDLTVLVEQAVDALLEKVEKRRLGKTSRPAAKRRAAAPAKASGKAARDVRRRVFKRDGERCTFTAADGRRCATRRFLELDHVVPRSKGGTDDELNLRVRCRAHNGLYAEQVFGKSYVRARIHLRQRKSAEAKAKAKAKAKGNAKAKAKTANGAKPAT